MSIAMIAASAVSSCASACFATLSASCFLRIKFSSHCCYLRSRYSLWRLSFSSFLVRIWTICSSSFCWHFSLLSWMRWSTSTAVLDEEASATLFLLVLSLPAGLAGMLFSLPSSATAVGAVFACEEPSPPVPAELLLSSKTLSFHFDSFRRIFQQCMNWKGSTASYIRTASSICKIQTSRQWHVKKFRPALSLVLKNDL